MLCAVGVFVAGVDGLEIVGRLLPVGIVEVGVVSCGGVSSVCGVC